MILSTCNEDQIDEGHYFVNNDTIHLISKDAPKMALKNFRPADSKLGPGLILKSPDPLLLNQCTYQFDDRNEHNQIPHNKPIQFHKNIQINFEGLDPLEIKLPFAEDITTWPAEIHFENMNSVFENFQSWIPIGRKLHLANNEMDIQLKKKKKCWLY